MPRIYLPVSFINPENTPATKPLYGATATPCCAVSVLVLVFRSFPTSSTSTGTGNTVATPCARGVGAGAGTILSDILQKLVKVGVGHCEGGLIPTMI